MSFDALTDGNLRERPEDRIPRGHAVQRSPRALQFLRQIEFFFEPGKFRPTFHDDGRQGDESARQGTDETASRVTAPVWRADEDDPLHEGKWFKAGVFPE